MFNTYYNEELAFLRELGREFGAAHPTVAHMLESKGADPDVDRLLEGVAFLTGRIRQKIDDELPELFQSLMSLMWPHYLRPVPSTAILQFQPAAEQLSSIATVARGVEVSSVPVDGTSCRFRTCYDTSLAPIQVADVALDIPMAADAALRITVRAAGRAPLGQLKLKSLRFYLADDTVQATTLYLFLLRYARYVQVRNPAKKRMATLPEGSIRAVGFGREEAILPFPPHSFMGYRLIQEYFTCPGKFMFVDILNLAALANLDIEDSFEIVIPFSRRPGDDFRVSRDSMRLFCTPIVNLFEHATDGIRIDHRRTQYRLRPSTAGAPAEHYEIYSVNAVQGVVQGEGRRHVYPPLHAFKHATATPESTIYYQSRIYDAVVGDGTDIYLSFVSIDEKTRTPPTETVSVDITATNRNLASRLKIGDVNAPTASSPEFARFRNITPVSRALRPPLGRGLHWRLISHLSLNYLSLTNIEALRGILELYNYQALYDRQAARENIQRLEGLEGVDAKPVERLLRGAPARGTAIELRMKEDNFASEGEMYLFASLLNEFFALYSSVNALTELKVRGTKYGEIYEWPARLGQQVVL